MLIVLKETQDYIIVNKPGGLITERNPFEDSLEAQVYNYLSKVKNNPFVGVVHRLDRVTSGVVLFAKKKSALQYFNMLFEKKNIRKTYLAITNVPLLKPKATLVDFLTINPKLKKAICSKQIVKGAKKSELTYKRLGVSGIYSLLQVKPKTGRFHQIRAQLSNKSLPICGDKLYGSEEVYEKQAICLHAFALEFKALNSDVYVCVQAPIPQKTPWIGFLNLIKSMS